MHYPKFIIPPITNRTAADIEEVKSYLNGTIDNADLYDKADKDLYEAADKDLLAKRSPYTYYGALNYTDLNRIEYNLVEAAKACLWYGYPTRTIKQIETMSMCSSGYLWSMDKIPYKSLIDHIRTNAERIRQQLLPFLPTVSFANTLDYTDANLLENIALQTDVVLKAIDESASFCGQSDLICGGV